MITLTDRAGSALASSLSEEDRVNGVIFRFNLLDDSSVELEKAAPVEGDETLEHEGYPVLAVPGAITSAFEDLKVDVTPAPDGQSMNLVIKTGEEQ